ncbi:hypothetical protein PVL29_015392 [Vitis rotundifolia]|uniref:Cellulose synthase-like protein H1 n=1 Tax=Vitis rotundifolia TaxID=103349 RepID=A0AA39DIU4_VITRO|nr:hypothetical protein PVL29_015392 [Vitis rotundifolia]
MFWFTYSIPLTSSQNLIPDSNYGGPTSSSGHVCDNCRPHAGTPLIITVNTVLSLLAVDYPANKLSCYVSDDGASPLTYFALLEGSKFAKLWVPFCKKYFSSELVSSHDNSMGFLQEYNKIKLTRKIEDATLNSKPYELGTAEFVAFSNVERRNHPTIIKVILQSKERRSDGLPHLTRVSGVMTNAPFMMNVDCDKYANNPQIFHHAMCLLLRSKNEQECGFVQTPQLFYDGPKDDPFGNQLVVWYKYMGSGIVGLEGPMYSGTGCFHRRKVIYAWVMVRWQDGNQRKKTAVRILSGLSGNSDGPYDLSHCVEAAHHVATCSYEYGTSWGIGWFYGSTTEDILTGKRIHSKGWKSTDCRPYPPAFFACVPSGRPASLAQMKRWTTGLLEVLFCKNSPVIAIITAKLHFRQCLAYMWILSWGLRPIPELCYLALPAYCIMAGSHFLAKVQEPAVLMPISLFVSYNFYTLLEHSKAGLSIRACWNNLRMGRITPVTSWLFEFFSVILKLLGLSETVFEVTKKDQATTPGEGSDRDAGRFTFDGSLIFVPATTRVVASGGSGCGLDRTISCWG